uniref:STI1 domain-containing protein n=1 Tax=Oryza punctata TaxID=4537 RepID=A0A0E0MDH7_ORYPU
MDASRVGELRAFVEACKKDPSLLADPNIAFFRDYLESLGAHLPAAAFTTNTKVSDPLPPSLLFSSTPIFAFHLPSSLQPPSSMDDIDDEYDDDDDDLNMRDATPEPDELDQDIVESDLELEGDIVESDHQDPPQKMGDPSIDVTEENRDASQEAKSKAMEAMSEGKLEEAIDHLTKAILLNPLSAIMYGTRASVFIKMKKPVAAIRDANAALEINPDSAKGYKTRGMAYAMLGKWEEAAHDLHTASNMDYDDEINAVLKKVEPNAHKIMEHRRKYERLRKEREEKRAERDRFRRRAEAQAAYDKAKRKEQSSSRSSGGASPGGGFPGGMPGGGFPGEMPGGGFPGGMPGGGFPGGMPGGFPGGAMPGGVPGNVDMSKILNDPDLMAAFGDPEVMAALQDVMNNPASFARHQANPKVGPIIAKMMAKFNGSQKTKELISMSAIRFVGIISNLQESLQASYSMSLITDDPNDSPRDCSSSYKHHHHRALHGGHSRSRRRALVVASSALVSLASLSLILWLVLRPSTPRFSLLAATTTANASSSVVAINAAFAARNPNSHAAALYDHLQARASYAGLPLTAPSPLPPFDHPPQQGDAVLSASLSSPPAAAAVAGGRALLRLRLEGQLRWKVAAWVTGRHALTVDCIAVVELQPTPTPSPSAIVGVLQGQGGSRCSTTVA